MASGDNVALGAPRFVFSAVAVGVGDGEGVSVGDGVSLGSGVGEGFFFRFADGDGLGDGDSDFFFAEALGEGDGDSFFVVDDFFFLWGVGVGVGEEKAFFIFSPKVSWAEWADPITRTVRMTKMAKRFMQLITNVTLPLSVVLVKVVLRRRASACPLI